MKTPRHIDPRPWAALLEGADYGEAYLEVSSGASIHFEDSRVEDMTAGSDQGLGLRYLNRDSASGSIQTIYGSLNFLDLPGATELRSRLLGGASKKTRSASLGLLRFHAPEILEAPESVPLERKIRLLQGIDAAIRSEFPYIRQVSLSYAEKRKEFVVMNSDGLAMGEERCSVLLAIQVTAEKDGILQTGYEVQGGLKGYELVKEWNPIETGKTAARRAVAKLTAPLARAGEMPVVLSSSAGGTFVHEAIGHSLEADHVQEGTSPHYRGKIGKIVAPEFLSIIDDPTLPAKRGSYASDDEGTPASPTLLVEKGMLKNYLYDRLTALKDNVPSNAHGRRESYHHRPIPRMSNLFIAPGKDDPNNILEELKQGLFVTRMGGGQVDTATGEFVFEVEEGFWVENGKVMHPLRDANLLGVGPTVLHSIDRLGTDLGWGIGTCGKDGQGVPVSDAQPTLRIPKLLVGGRQE